VVGGLLAGGAGGVVGETAGHLVGQLFTGSGGATTIPTGATYDEIYNAVVETVAEQLNRPSTSISPSSRFVDDLCADSLDVVELVMALEDTAGLDIPDDDAEKLVTVADAVRYIAAHRPSG